MTPIPADDATTRDRCPGTSGEPRASDVRSRQVDRDAERGDARFRALGDAFPLGVFVTGPDGACTYVNERWETIMGLARSDALGTGWSRALHPDDRDAVIAEWREEGARLQGVDRTLRILRPDGTTAHVRAISRPVLADDGTVREHVGSVEDITERVLQVEALRRSERLLNETGAMASVGGWEVDVEAGSVHWCDQTCRIHGLPPGYRPKLDEAIRFYAPEARPVIEAAVERATTEGIGWDLELRLIRADGRPIWVRALGHAEFEQDRVVRLLGAFQDVSEGVEQRRALELAHERISRDVEDLRTLSDELEEQRELLEVTLQSIADAVITTDGVGRVTWLNPVAERLTGHLSAVSVGKALSEVFRTVDEETRRAIPDPVTACLERGKAVSVADRTVLVSRTGEEFGIEHSAAPILKSGERSLGVVLVFRDVSERRRMSVEMAYRATHDSLTGLVNRREFEARLERTLVDVRERGGDHALMCIDLDRFKIVNDTCGHAVGDELLREVSGLLGRSVRADDTLARVGGDEFAVILKRCTPDQAARAGRQICERMDEFRFVRGEHRFRLGTSIGVVPLDARWGTAAAIVQAADAACYRAKEAGRNRVVAWTDARSAEARPRAPLAGRIEAALERNGFELHAQRIEESSGSIGCGVGNGVGRGVELGVGPRAGIGGELGVRAEVLIRLRDGDGELIPPDAFLPAAERYQLAARIDRWVLHRIVERLRSGPAPLPTLCVNLSAHSLADRAFRDDVIELLAREREEVRRRLCLEIPEAAVTASVADACAFARRVHELGVQVALDDFGANASSFGYLKGLPADVLKLDGQLVQRMMGEPLDGAAVRCFVDVARVTGARTVAKHVDRPEVLRRVRELGIDRVQGFLVHRPEPLERALERAGTEGTAWEHRRAS